MRRALLRAGSPGRARRRLAFAGALLLVGAGCQSTEGAERKGEQPAAEELEEEEQAARDRALTELAELEARRAPPREVAAYLDEDQPEEVRWLAARALARLEHTDATDLLLQALSDESPRVRAQGAFGLGQLDTALDVGRDEHDQVRGSVERLLVFTLDKERDPTVRRALIRSLGRLAVGSGLEALKRLAKEEGPERAAALTALGVSGNRRGASLRLDPVLADAARAGLESEDVEVRRAAAYVVFRQKMRMPDPGVELLRGAGDAQTRIHLLRALGEGAGPGELAESQLTHDDWRVRAEAVRVLGAQSPVPVGPLVEVVKTSAGRLEAGRRAGDAHVVRLACLSLINAPAETTRSVLAETAARLARVRPDAGCACAVAHDAQQARLEKVKSCAPTWADERIRRLGVQVAHRSMISTAEKAAWLKTALKDGSPQVRLAAADALAEERTRAAAEVAAMAVASEADAAVAGALLRALRGEHEERLESGVLFSVIERFLGAQTVEETEPLLEGLRLLESRQGPRADELRARLASHPDAHVRLRAADHVFGERPHAPFAKPDPAPRPRALPAFAVLRTERGPIRIRFLRERAPGTVQNFVELAKRGTLDQTPFHRVVPDFVAQGGDPRGDGTGGPGYTIACENHDGAYTRGAVGMALAGKDTGGSQFFLTHSEQPHLDGRYTLFGRVVEGAEVMDELGPGDRLLGVRIEEAGEGK